MIHSALYGNSSFEVLNKIVEIFSTIVPAFCVPLFLMISGYLFFLKVAKFSYQTYNSKLKKRIKTLLWPYIFWNVAVAICFYLLHRFLPNYINPDLFNISTYSFSELIYVCFFIPIAYQFWFIRDLMVYVILTPLFYIILKRGKWGVILLIMLYLLDIPLIWPGCFFGIGAFAAIQKFDYAAFAYKFRLTALIISIVSVVIIASGINPYFSHIYILSSILAILGYSRSLCKIKISGILTESSFFLFCVHTLPLLLVIRIASKLLAEFPEWCWIVTYFAVPIFIVVLSTVCYRFLNNICPKFLSFILGGR